MNVNENPPYDEENICEKRGIVRDERVKASFFPYGNKKEFLNAQLKYIPIFSKNKFNE